MKLNSEASQELCFAGAHKFNMGDAKRDSTSPGPVNQIVVSNPRKDGHVTYEVTTYLQGAAPMVIRAAAWPQRDKRANFSPAPALLQSLTRAPLPPNRKFAGGTTTFCGCATPSRPSSRDTPSRRFRPKQISLARSRTCWRTRRIGLKGSGGSSTLCCTRRISHARPSFARF